MKVNNFIVGVRYNSKKMDESPREAQSGAK